MERFACWPQNSRAWLYKRCVCAWFDTYLPTCASAGDLELATFFALNSTHTQAITRAHHFAGLNSPPSTCPRTQMRALTATPHQSPCACACRNRNPRCSGR